VFVLTATVSFKFNKAFYSFFYDSAQCQALFSRSKYYRKILTWFTIIWIILVDLVLISIDVTGLTKVTADNQLFITMIETLVLSVLSIIFSSIELMRLKVYLQYTEEPKKKTELVKLKKDTDSESDDKNNWDKKFDNKEMANRRAMMGDLLKQVKHNKQIFLNNKLDELLA
jgi:hypothetical protein